MSISSNATPDYNFTGQIKQNFLYLIDEYGFSLTEELFSPESFGNALVIYSSEHVDITITLDRGEVLVDLTPAFDMSKRTYSLPVLLNYLNIRKSKAVHVAHEKRLDYNTQVIRQIEQVAQMLKRHCSSILIGQFTEWEFMG